MSDENEQEPVAYTLDIDMSNRPGGYLVQIPGLGTFKNGSSYEITEREAHNYRVYHTRQIPITGESDEILGSKTELGLTLAEAAEFMYGVTVTDSSGNVHTYVAPQPEIQQQDVSDEETPSDSSQTTEVDEGGVQ